MFIWLVIVVVCCRLMAARKAGQKATRLPLGSSPPQTNGSVKDPPESSLQAASSETSLPSHSPSPSGARNNSPEQRVRQICHLMRPGMYERRVNEDGGLSNNQEEVVNLWRTARLEQLRAWSVKVCYLISLVLVRYGYTVSYYNKTTHLIHLLQ